MNVMFGASREALRSLREVVGERTGLRRSVRGGGPSRPAAALRGALADGGTPEDDRTAIVDRLLSGRIGDESLDVVKEAVRLRWSSSVDLSDAMEIVGAQAAFMASEACRWPLDRVEDELFQFGRMLAAQPQLQNVLDDPGLPVDHKLAVLDGLLAERVDPTTLVAPSMPS